MGDKKGATTDIFNDGLQILRPIDNERSKANRDRYVQRELECLKIKGENVETGAMSQGWMFATSLYTSKLLKRLIRRQLWNFLGSPKIIF